MTDDESSSPVVASKKRSRSQSNVPTTTTTTTTTTATTTDVEQDKKKRRKSETVTSPTTSVVAATAAASGITTSNEEKEYAYSAPSVTHIKDTAKRRQLRAAVKHQKNSEKRKRKEQRQQKKEALGDAAPPPQVPRTLENTREPDDTMVEKDDAEVKEDTGTDEFAEYFANKTTPKILITTSRNVSKKGKETLPFIHDLEEIIPNTTFRPRRNYPLKDIVQFCKEENYTDIMVITEHSGQPHSLLLCHLPNGPTAMFRLSSIVLQKSVHNHARPTEHFPELILNNFNTRLGYSVGRMLSAMVPQTPEFPGRRVMTFHNQRDFIFFRHHRYIFDSEKKARLQEIGPRFTLKLKYLQHGTFDSKFGEYEWIPKKEMVTSRRRFFL